MDKFLGYAGEQDEIDESKPPLVVAGNCKPGDCVGFMRVLYLGSGAGTITSRKPLPYLPGQGMRIPTMDAWRFWRVHNGH